MSAVDTRLERGHEPAETAAVAHDERDVFCAARSVRRATRLPVSGRVVFRIEPAE